MSKIQVTIEKAKSVSGKVNAPIGTYIENNYNNLTNKPTINNVMLQGDVSLTELGIKNMSELEYEEVT